MKKCLMLTLCVMLCACFCLHAAAAAPAVECTVEGETWNPGDELTVTVSLSASPKVTALALTPVYDPEIFQLVSGEWTLSNALLKAFDEEKGNAAAMFAAATELKGEVFEFVLRVRSDAASGSAKISVKPVIKGADKQTVEAEAKEIKVTIGERSCNHLRMKEYEAREPGCVTSGRNTYYVCTDCDVVFKADRVTRTTEEEETLAHLGHNWTDGACTRCGAVKQADGSADATEELESATGYTEPMEETAAPDEPTAPDREPAGTDVTAEPTAEQTAQTDPSPVEPSAERETGFDMGLLLWLCIAGALLVTVAVLLLLKSRRR